MPSPAIHQLSYEMSRQNTSLNHQLRTIHCLEKILRGSRSHIRCLLGGHGSAPCLPPLPDEGDDDPADDEDEKDADDGLPPNHAAHLLTVLAVVDRSDCGHQDAFLLQVDLTVPPQLEEGTVLVFPLEDGEAAGANLLDHGDPLHTPTLQVARPLGPRDLLSLAVEEVDCSASFPGAVFGSRTPLQNLPRRLVHQDQEGKEHCAQFRHLPD